MEYEWHLDCVDLDTGAITRSYRTTVINQAVVIVTHGRGSNTAGVANCC
jgi:hypothetical protein